jgi:hypothetical protein
LKGNFDETRLDNNTLKFDFGHDRTVWTRSDSLDKPDKPISDLELCSWMAGTKKPVGQWDTGTVMRKLRDKANIIGHKI